MPGAWTFRNDQAMDITSLLQRRGGLFAGSTRILGQALSGQVVTRIVPLGNIQHLNRFESRGEPFWSEPSRALTGSATDAVDDRALFLALAEALERYSVCMHREDQCIWATAEELGNEAVDLDLIPRCSPSELADPHCPLTLPSKTEPIRWVRGLSLRDGRIVYLPVVLVYLRAPYQCRAERIALPITTGCATHCTYEEALLHGICEVVERDAVSLVWLQVLQLPRIEFDECIPECCELDSLSHSSTNDLAYHLFDATTDVGIPTIYGLQVAARSETLRHLVACSCNPQPEIAVRKVLRDMVSMRIALRGRLEVPEDIADFSDVMHGAAYMGNVERSHAFSFLLNSQKRIRFSKMRLSAMESSPLTLTSVLRRLSALNLEAFAVDLSTDEAIRSGLRVVRVLIPGLQPLSFHYRARYLGHPRLYEGPRALGYPVRGEQEINHWPQPFG